MTSPLLLCLPLEKLADVIQKLDDYQVLHHKCRFPRPAYLDEERVPIIHAPDYLEEEEMRVEKEMRRRPRYTKGGRGYKAT